MKKLIAMVLAVAMLAGLGVVAFADGDAAAPGASLSRLDGTYIELFPEFAREEYYDYWMECIGAYVPDEELAGMYYDMLTRNYMGTLMGQEAVEAYGEEPEAMLFDCFFENGLQKITVSGDRISGENAEGDTVFSHVYSYAGEAPISFFGEDMGLSLQVYKTDDEDAGIFTYFAFTDDNMADTQHIEFRYGGALDDLGNYSDGEYAYWLAAGIAEGYEDSVIRACIKLFVDENVGGGEEAPDYTETGILPAIAGEDGTTYANLFDIILDEDCYSLWYDYCAAVTGEENAAAAVAALQGSISSELYGEEAVEAFAGGENGLAFDCFYIQDVDTFTFAGDTITANRKDGSSETHTYEYIGVYEIGAGETMEYMGQELSMAFPCFVYESTDEAGEFNYFFLREDTMAETYHIEFRYGRDLEELQGYLVGPYAYWLAAGIDAEADEQTLENVIALFCLENMDYSTHTDSALEQLADLGFVGTWQADMSAFGEEYAGIELTMTIDENGHGVTFMNGEQTADFEAYAVDSGEKGDGQGLYVAWSNLDYEAEAAPYSMTVSDDDQTVLTLTADDGTIRWIRQDAEASAEVIEIATAEELAAINENLSGHFILTADIDLAGMEWTPIGAFHPLSDAPEDAEVPHPDYAFTGSFNGNGHIISNLTISNASPMGAGLFGCASGTEQGEAYIGNFTLENINVSGGYLVGGAVGLQFMGCNVSDITLIGENKLTGLQGIGGIVGTGFDLISNCSATADIIVMGNDGACAGLIAGGTTMSSIENCHALGGSITAEGDATWAFGAICGAPWGAPEIKDCTASKTLIRVTGADNRLVGGLLGFAGTYDPENPAQIVGCTVDNVIIEVSESTDSVGGLIGAGKEMMEGSDVMSLFEVRDCSVSGSITGGGKYLDAVVGDPACAVNIVCEGGMTLMSPAMGTGIADSATEPETAQPEVIISSVDDFLSFSASVNDGSAFGYAGQTILLDVDLDLDGVAWEPIGNLSDPENFSTVFMGTFDGRGHTISNLTCETDESIIGAGLFGVSFGDIRNVNMDHCTVSVTGLEPGASQAVGVIVGYNMGGTITGCSVSDSSVTGLNCVGAIAGGSGGVVTDCTVTDCTVTIIGDNDFTDGLKQCDVAECGGLIVGGAFGGTVSRCTASGRIIAEGNEPVGLGGIAGCLEMMNDASDNTVDVEIITVNGGHAIGGLCGYAGTHSDLERMLVETGVEITEYPGKIHDCTVTAIINAPGATHVGGLIGTNLYFFGEETTWDAYDCTVTAQINGAVTPGALAGRAENCSFENCAYTVEIDGSSAEAEIGTTAVMYESLDQ